MISKDHSTEKGAMNKVWKAFQKSLWVAGASLGTSIIAYPLDTLTTIVKTKMNITATQELQRIVFKQKAWKELFAGIRTLPFECIVPLIVYYCTYDLAHDSMKKKVNSPFLVGATAGAVAECFALIFQLPIELIQIRMQNGLYKGKPIIGSLRDVVQKEGLWRLYKVSPLYLFINFAYASVLFAIYESVSNSLKRDSKEFSLGSTLFSSLVATSVAVLVTNPFDNIFIKYQIKDFSKTKPESLLSAHKKYLSKYSFSGFFKGTSVRLLTHIVHTVAILPFYDFIRTHDSEFTL